jgi:hypothetical protein
MEGIDKLFTRINELKPGERLVESNLREDVYHQSPGIGSTGMKAAIKSMAHYDAYRRRGNEDHSAATLKAFRVGSLTHCLVLEPALFNEKFVAQPETIKRRAGKQWETFLEKAGDREIATHDEMALASKMAEAVAYSECASYFMEGESELSIWYRHETGILLKARLDYKIGDLGIDLKTTAKETPREFAQSVKYDYDIQEALYRMVSGVADFVFVGVCKKDPFSIYLAKQGSDVRALAEKRLNAAINNLAIAQEFDEYPNIPIEMIETSLMQYEAARAQQ